MTSSRAYNAFRKMRSGTIGGQSRVATPVNSLRVLASAAPHPAVEPEPDSPVVWVAVGLNSTSGGGRLATSGDGIAWTFSTTFLNFARCVAWNGEMWVIGGSDPTQCILTSLDRVTWTARSSPFDNGDVWGVAWGDDQWVAVGGSPGGEAICTSSDGINWTAQTSPFDGVYPLQPDGRGRCVAYHAGLWVAGGVSGSNDPGYVPIITSSDGINWTERSSPFDDLSVDGIAYGDNQWVAGGLGNPEVVMTSPNGVNWTVRSSPGDGQRVASVAYHDGLWVAGLFSGSVVIMTSSDGITWTTRSSSLDSGSGGQARGIAWGGSLWTVVGQADNSNNSVAIVTSPDGITWTERSSDPHVSLLGVVSSEYTP